MLLPHTGTRIEAGIMNREIGPIVHWKHGPLALLILSFALAQLYLASVHDFPTTRFETDGISYMKRASGPLFTADPYHGPGYPLAIRLVRGATRLSPFVAAQLVSILAGILLISAAYRVFSLSDGHRTAYRAAVFTAFTPCVVKYSGMILSDALGAALMWTTIWILTRAQRPAARHLFAAGLVAGLAYLTRYVFLFLVVVPPLLLLLTRRWTRSALFALLGFYAGFFLATIPWGAFLWHVKGNPFWNHNHLNIAFKMYRDGRGWNFFPSVDQFPTAASVVMSDPLLFIKGWFRTLLDIPLATMDLIPIAGVTLGTLGVLLWFTKFNVRKLTIVLALAGYCLLVALAWIAPRFLVPMAPFVALCISRAIEVVPERASMNLPRSHFVSRWTVPFRFLTTVVVLLGIVSASRSLPSWFLEHQADEYVKAANWLKANHADRNTTVLAAKPHIPFFSGATGVEYRRHDLQSAESSDLGAALALIRPDYFIYDERYASVEFPQFRHLLEAGNQVDYLRPVLTIDSPMRLVVFEYVARDHRKVVR